MISNKIVKMWSYLVLVSITACALAGPPIARSRQEIEAFQAFLEKSRTDDVNGVRFQARMLANPLASAWENSGKYQGDILLDDEQLQYLVREYAAGRNAYIWPDTTWPDNTIVYELAPHFDEAQTRAILEGIKDIEDHTCLEFREREPEDENYVRVTGTGGGCYAHVGYWPTRGVHLYNLALSTPGRGCFRHTTVVHEWLHIIGFYHMQSTHDRDDYVRIMWDNIISGLEFNFDKYSSEIVDNLELPYEYDSNMHYGSHGFSNNGEPTIVPLYDDKDLMGQQQYITDNDWLRVNRHYNCPGAWHGTSHEQN